jgi:ABC-type nitrate/sulfonate/bicarbonate transport system substrate-binding protein
VIGGFQVKLVACYLPRSTLVIVGRPEIDSVKALKGKTVAVAGFTSSNFAIMRLIAKHFGLDPEKDMKILAVGGNEARLASLRHGLVAATVVPPHWDFHAQKLGFHVIAKSHEFLAIRKLASSLMTGRSNKGRKKLSVSSRPGSWRIVTTGRTGKRLSNS